MSRLQTRYTLGDLPDLRDLFMDYRSRLLRHGHNAIKGWPYAYGVFDDGIKIPNVARRVWAEMDGSQERWPNPFRAGTPESFRSWLNHLEQTEPAAAPLLTRLALEIYNSQAPLQKAFPDLDERHRLRFAKWFVIVGQLEYELDDVDRKSTRLNSSHIQKSRMPSSA